MFPYSSAIVSIAAFRFNSMAEFRAIFAVDLSFASSPADIAGVTSGHQRVEGNDAIAAALGEPEQTSNVMEDSLRQTNRLAMGITLHGCDKESDH